MIEIVRSRWGWTAVVDGREVAHSVERSWLEAYVKSSVPTDLKGD